MADVFKEPRRQLDPIIYELRRLRYERGIKLRDLSTRAGYSKKTLVQWEGGHYSPRHTALRDWCDALGVELILREKETH